MKSFSYADTNYEQGAEDLLYGMVPDAKVVLLKVLLKQMTVGKDKRIDEIFSEFESAEDAKTYVSNLIA